MSRVLDATRQTPGRARDFAVGLLLAAGVATPAFAATFLTTELTTDDWRTLLLVGFVVLLGVGLLLKMRRKRPPALPAWSSPTEATRYNRYTIGQDRPNAYH